MSPVETLREFVNRRLSAAAGEIFSVFLPTLVQYQEQIQTLVQNQEQIQTLVQYQEQIQTQQRLLQISCRESSDSQRTDESQNNFCREEQLRNKQQRSSIDQQELEPPQTKEEPEEPEHEQTKEGLLGVNRLSDTVKLMVLGGQSEPRENLDSHNSVRELINQRLTAAAGEIFTEFQQAITQYQEEIQTQQRLLEITSVPQIKLHRIDGPEQQMKSSLEHKEPEAPQMKEEQEETETLQIKEEQEEPETLQIKEQQESESPQIKEEEMEFYSSHEEEQLVLKQEVYHFIIPSHEQSQSIEPESESELLLFQDSVVAGSQHQEKIHLVDSGTTTKAVLEAKKRLHSKNLENSPFTPQSSLSASRKTGEKPHSCDICGKNFRCTSYLLLHMRIHTGETPYSCVTCGKGYSRTTSLLRHMRSHTGENPNSCVTCGKSFCRRVDLLVHMKIHPSEKPFLCETCGQSFSIKSNLLVHMSTHTGEKPYTSTQTQELFPIQSSS